MSNPHHFSQRSWLLFFFFFTFFIFFHSYARALDDDDIPSGLNPDALLLLGSSDDGVVAGQTGNANELFAGHSGLGNLILSAQEGDGNISRVNQNGNSNSAIVEQTGNGNQAEIHQNPDSTQIPSSSGVFPPLLQTGGLFLLNCEGAELACGPSDGIPAGFSDFNQASIIQNGERNVAGICQGGANNLGDIFQNTFLNTAGICQNGLENGASISHSQLGDSNDGTVA